MPLHQVNQGLFQRLSIKLPAQAQCARNIVGRASAQLIQRPQTFLPWRKGNQGTAMVVVPQAAHAGNRARNVFLRKTFKATRQLPGCGVFKQTAQGKILACALADAGQKTDGQQRMPAQTEKVVFHAHGFHPGQFAEKAADQGLGFGCGCAIIRASGKIRFRQGPAVDLAIGRERQGRYGNKGRRNHVVWQPSRQRLTQCFCI